MRQTDQQVRQVWEDSFEEQIAREAYNTAPVEALARMIAYYLRDRFPSLARSNLHFLEMGCGAGPNLIWLAQKGAKVSGVDIAPTVVKLARTNLEKAGYAKNIGQLVEASVSNVPFADQSFDGILEACVFQHLDKENRKKAFQEVSRLLKPGGIFVGYMLETGHTVFQKHKADQLRDDPGTLILTDGRSKIYLTNIGVTHFFNHQEMKDLFKGFSIVDPCLTTYYLPKDEARKRGYDEYLQSMLAVYAIK